VVSTAFDRALAQAGGSASAWQGLVLVRSGQWGTQSEMARAMGITGATLTHHLNALESQGLGRRWREGGNRRAQQGARTEAGAAFFDRLGGVALEHDERLRASLSERETEQLAGLLEKLRMGIEA